LVLLPMIELAGGPSAGDGNNGPSRVGWTAPSLAELREGFAGVSDKKIFVIFETIGWRDREASSVS
jgi:hypothetical protein